MSNDEQLAFFVNTTYKDLKLFICPVRSRLDLKVNDSYRDFFKYVHVEAVVWLTKNDFDSIVI